MNPTINTFVESERSRFETTHNNMFALSFSHVTRYYDFLLIIKDRYGEVSELARINSNKLQEEIDKIAPGPHQASKEILQILQNESSISIKLHLEIESFYLFAKILLDQLSRGIEFYFGQGRKASLDSHDDFCKNISSYSSQKDLKLDAQLISLAEELKKRISDFRDYNISHNKKPRNIKFTRFNNEGKALMASNNIYPGPKDEYIETRDLGELLQLIDSYIDQSVSFLKENSSKTNLPLIDIN